MTDHDLVYEIINDGLGQYLDDSTGAAPLDATVDKILAALREAGWRKVPEGWKLVPKNPTNGMLQASTNQIPTWDDYASLRKWNAMLAVAPDPPEEG